MYHKEKQNNCRDTKVQSIVKRRQKTTTKTHLTTTKRPKNHHTETRNDYKAAGNSSKETPWPSGCKWGAGRPFTRLCPGPCCLTIPSTAVGGDEMRRSRASVAGWGDGGGGLSHKSLFVSRSVYSAQAPQRETSRGRSSVGVPLSRWRRALMQRFSMRLLLSWRWCEIWARGGGAHEGDAWQQPVGAAHSKNALLRLEFGALLSTAQINRAQRLGQIYLWARWWICIFQTYSSYL